MTNPLIAKYNVAGPRYTSYPTVPFWNTDEFSLPDWQQRLTTAFAETNSRTGISLYIHLPYCESLCTFCACHKRITKNHGVETPYIDSVLAEWALYCNFLPERPRLAELHLGGGTPSFFSPHELRRLLTGIFALADPTDAPDYSWEGHPNNTTVEHLQTLYDFGFRRVSFGVQDYDPVVQKAIHRLQPVNNVRLVTEQARAIGYTSVSHDLVFGLPHQRVKSIQNTIAQTLAFRPERIAFYSYAHVPWLKGNGGAAFGQRGFSDADLPTAEAKRELYELGRDALEAGGYAEIGMDHFALPHDPLYEAMQTGTLHRNFMGYTTRSTGILLGLGASSIGDVGAAFMQNEKDISAYQAMVSAGQLPIVKGHLHSPTDSRIQELILDILCRLRGNWSVYDWTETEWTTLAEKLDGFRADGLLDYDETGLQVRPAGRPFLRNIAMVFDRYLTNRQISEKPLFSQTV